MDAVFKKLNFKEHKQVLLLNTPQSFVPNVQAMQGFTQFVNSLEQIPQISFTLAFVTQLEQVNALAPAIAAKLEGDAVLWMAYPKASSKKYTCNFNRDTGWDIMGTLGLEPVRMVAIDQDWSALRFRRVQYIKHLTRRQSMALTPEAKKRTSGK